MTNKQVKHLMLLKSFGYNEVKIEEERILLRKDPESKPVKFFKSIEIDNCNWITFDKLLQDEDYYINFLTPDKAIKYYNELKLTNSSINKFHLYELISLLLTEFDTCNKEKLTEGSTVYWNTILPYEKSNIFYKDDGSLLSCKIFASGNSFNSKEIITFTEDLKVHFNNGIDNFNMQPVFKAFIGWCDLLAGLHF